VYAALMGMKAAAAATAVAAAFALPAGTGPLAGVAAPPPYPPPATGSAVSIAALPSPLSTTHWSSPSLTDGLDQDRSLLGWDVPQAYGVQTVVQTFGSPANSSQPAGTVLIFPMIPEHSSAQSAWLFSQPWGVVFNGLSSGKKYRIDFTETVVCATTADASVTVSSSISSYVQFSAGLDFGGALTGSGVLQRSSVVGCDSTYRFLVSDTVVFTGYADSGSPEPAATLKWLPSLWGQQGSSHGYPQMSATPGVDPDTVCQPPDPGNVLSWLGDVGKLMRCLFIPTPANWTQAVAQDTGEQSWASATASIAEAYESSACGAMTPSIPLGPVTIPPLSSCSIPPLPTIVTGFLTALAMFITLAVCGDLVVWGLIGVRPLRLILNTFAREKDPQG